MHATTLYDVLAIKPEATTQEIEAAYEHLVKFYAYKDSMVGASRLSSSEKQVGMSTLTLAYETLTDEAARAEYDLYLMSQGKKGKDYWNWEPGSADPEDDDETKREKEEARARRRKNT